MALLELSRNPTAFPFKLYSNPTNTLTLILLGVFVFPKLRPRMMTPPSPPALITLPELGSIDETEGAL